MRAFLFLVLSAVIALPGAFAGQKEQVYKDCVALSDCWQHLFPSVRAALKDATLATEWRADQYERVSQKKLNEVLQAEVEEKRRLDYLQASVRSYLDECQALQGVFDAGEPTDVLIVGQPRDADGRTFDLAAMNYYNRRVKERCGSLREGSRDYENCRKRVIVIKNPGKERLLAFLRVLKPDSISSFTYVGHGAPDQIIIGQRSMDRVHNDIFARDRRAYSAQEDGSIYAEDLEEGRPLGNAIHRAFRRDAKVSLIACETGQEFAAVLGRAAEVPGVYASTVGMHFTIVDEKGRLVHDPGPTGNLPPLRRGQFLELAPDKKGEYRRIASSSAGNSQPSIAGMQMLGDDASRHEYAQNVTSRISTGSASWVKVMNDDFSESVVVFNEQDRKVLRRVFKKSKLLINGTRKSIVAALKAFPQIQSKLTRVLDQVELRRDTALDLTKQRAQGFEPGLKRPATDR